MSKPRNPVFRVLQSVSHGIHSNKRRGNGEGIGLFLHIEEWPRSEAGPFDLVLVCLQMLEHLRLHLEKNDSSMRVLVPRVAPIFARDEPPHACLDGCVDYLNLLQDPRTANRGYNCILTLQCLDERVMCVVGFDVADTSWRSVARLLAREGRD